MKRIWKLIELVAAVRVECVSSLQADQVQAAEGNE